MKRIASVAFLTFITSLAPTGGTSANQDGTIYWYGGDFPPYSIVAGPKQGQGIADQRKDLLVEYLPEFRHETIHATTARILQEIKIKPNACNVAYLKTPEREAIMEFSATPIQWILPNGIITSRNRLPVLKRFINDRGELKLDAFLNTGQYRLGIIAGRSFGTGIDAVLKKYKDKNLLVTVPSRDHSASRLLKLLNQSEYEAIVGYAIELNYIIRELGLNAGDFVFLPVAEEPSLIPTYVVCSKSDVGKHVIATVNRAITDTKTKQRVETSYRTWLAGENLALYDRLQQQLHNER